MAFKYKKHYTLEEARALLPEIRQWLERLLALRSKLHQIEQQIGEKRVGGDDLGGALPNASVRTISEIKMALLQFYRRDIQIKDLERGLLDFPAILAGKEVFLCWEKDEEDIEFWHDLDSGYAGREPLL
jgi:hypothetical protein